MDYNLPQNIEYCASVVNELLSFLYYSHIPPAIISLIVGLFIWTTLSAALGIIFPILGYQAMPVLANLRKFDIISI